MNAGTEPTGRGTLLALTTEMAAEMAFWIAAIEVVPIENRIEWVAEMMGRFRHVVAMREATPEKTLALLGGERDSARRASDGWQADAYRYVAERDRLREVLRALVDSSAEAFIGWEPSYSTRQEIEALFDAARAALSVVDTRPEELGGTAGAVPGSGEGS